MENVWWWALFFSGCATPPPVEDWRDQLHPDGPCWRVDLTDGLDEQATDELHALFDCLNQNKNFAPLDDLVATMDAPARDGSPLGASLARMVNQLPEEDIDVFGLAGLALEVIREQPALIRKTLQASVELVYGQSFSAVLPVSDVSVLDRGVIRPALPVLSEASRVLLDEDPEVIGSLSEAIDSEVFAEGVCLVNNLPRQVEDNLLSDLGAAVEAARSPGNDRWADASGDSLRDVTVALLVTDEGGETLGARVRDPLTLLLQDARLRQDLLDVLQRAADSGQLDRLAPQMRHLAAVDIDGGPLQPGEDAALTRLLRLLAAADAPLVCRIQVFGVELANVSLDNLAVEILEVLALQDDDVATTGLSLLGGALGFALTQSVLDTVVNTGVCPILTPQLADDLDAIDRLNDDAVADLLAVLLDALRALSPDRVEPLVGVFSAVHHHGAVPPIEEALRDLADAPLVNDAVLTIKQMLTTAAPAEGCATDITPLTLEAALVSVADNLDESSAGIQPLIDATLSQPEMWRALGNLGELLQDPTAELASGIALFKDLTAVDPELTVVRDQARLLRSPSLVEPVLMMTESEALMDALGQATPEQEGPMPFFSRLVIGDTVESLLRTVDLLLNALEE